MTAQDSVDRILNTLGDHLRASRRIGEIEARVGRSRGYFSKVAAGKWRISVDVLMQTLEVLEVEPQEFFRQAFAEPEAAAEPTPTGLRNVAEPPPPYGPGGLDWNG